MIHWKETTDIVARVAELSAVGREAALATVVAIEGSAYRRPGAKFLIEDEGDSLGGVSGGCLEADVRVVALEVMRDRSCRLRSYKMGGDHESIWGLGLGCDGRIDVFVQPVSPHLAGKVGERALALLVEDAPFTLSTVLEGSTGAGSLLIFEPNGRLHGSTGDPDLDQEIAFHANSLLGRHASSLDYVGSARVFTETLVPPPHLLICGGGDDAVPLAASALSIGFRVTVADHRPAYLSQRRFPTTARLLRRRPDEDLAELAIGSTTYAVIKMHSLEGDREWLLRLLDSDASYIGLLGPRPRTRELLGQVGGDPAGRVFGPVGLDLGADGPQQIALSILAEVLAVHSDRQPISLRERMQAIHVR